MLGKAKCKILKEIRQKIADENDIPYVTRECTYQGDCSGTCPRCESELRYLERELEKRERLGKKVALGALCAGITMGSVACTSPNAVGGDVPDPDTEIEQLSGEAVDGGPTPEIEELSGDVPENFGDDELGGAPEIEELEGDVSIEQLEGETAAPEAYYDPEYEAEAEARLTGFDIFGSNYQPGGISSGSRYYPEVTIEKDVMLRVVNTYHWNDGYGATPGIISIYDITDGGEELLGEWAALGRAGGQVPNVNWDIFPGLELKAGHTYRIVDSDPESWSSNDDSKDTGFTELWTDGEQISEYPEIVKGAAIYEEESSASEDEN